MTYDIKGRTREVLRQELVNAAFDLMLKHGYEQTAEEIADALGISRATFFRHLGSKEEVVAAAIIGPVDLFATAYRAGGAPKNASAWTRLKAAFAPAIAESETIPDIVRARLALIRANPALSSRVHRDRRPQVDGLAAALVAEGQRPLAATALAAAAVAVFDRCWSLWAGDENLALRDLVDEAFGHLDAASGAARGA